MPTMLYGYGGFGVSTSPEFNIENMLLYKHLGGMFVVANIRGGGEFGEKWHKSATKEHK